MDSGPGNEGPAEARVYLRSLFLSFCLNLYPPSRPLCPCFCFPATQLSRQGCPCPALCTVSRVLRLPASPHLVHLSSLCHGCPAGGRESETSWPGLAPWASRGLGDHLLSMKCGFQHVVWKQKQKNHWGSLLQKTSSSTKRGSLQLPGGKHIPVNEEEFRQGSWRVRPRRERQKWNVFTH